MIYDTDLFGAQIAPACRPASRIQAYASRPGTGPKGQRCNTCKHCQMVLSDGRRSRKCEIVAARWTPNEETDIKHNAPACRDWQRREYNKERMLP